MTNRAFLKSTGAFLLDVLEIYIPTLAFTVMFVVFILQVFYRYFLNNPLTWPPEIISLTFIWTTVLGACYAQRQNEHVMFTIIYDRLSPLGQLLFRVIGNGFIAVAFLIALKPSYEYIQFMEFKKSTVLKIPFSVIFFPFLVFVVLITGRMLYAVYLDLRQLIKSPGDLPRDDSVTIDEFDEFSLAEKDAL